MEREITVVVSLTDKNIARFQLSFLLKQWYAWLMLLPFAGAGVSVYKTIREGDSVDVLGGALGFFVLFLLLFISFFVATRRVRKNRFVMETKTFRFSEEQVLVESESMRQIFRWTDFVKYSRTAKAVYLFLNRVTAHVLPLDAIDPLDRDSLLLLIQSKVKKRNGIGCIGIAAVCLFLFLIVVGIVQYYISRNEG